MRNSKLNLESLIGSALGSPLRVKLDMAVRRSRVQCHPDSGPKLTEPVRLRSAKLRHDYDDGKQRERDASAIDREDPK